MIYKGCDWIIIDFLIFTGLLRYKVDLQSLQFDELDADFDYDDY